MYLHFMRNFIPIICLLICLLGQPQAQEPFLNTDPDVAFVGDEACAACHPSIYETYHQTGMGRSFYLPSSQNIIENFDNPAPIYDKQRDLYYQVYQKNDQFYQREYRQDQNGNVIHELTRQVSYVIGSGNHNRSYLINENGFLFEMPITWYTQRQKWDLSPGYQANNPRFARPIISDCMNCHNSYTPSQTYSENRYTDIALGIGCERCHGPGKLHIDKHYNPDITPTASLDPTIVNPKYLSRDLNNDICMQCHLQGKLRILKSDHKITDYRPGTPLNTFKSVYIQDDLPSGDFGIAGHGERFLLSDCYKASDITCTTCHDPHTPVQSQSRTFFNTRCISCHAIEDLTASANHDKNSNCVTCHMPQGQTADIPHVNFTDHWIRIVPPQEPPKIRPTSATITLKDILNQSTPDSLRLGMAYIQYYEAKHSHPDYLTRAIPLLEAGLKTQPNHPEAHYHLGLANTHLSNTDRAITHFQKTIQHKPDHGLAHFQLGRLLQNLNHLPQAEAAYRAALHAFPQNVRAHNNLGNVYAAQNKLNEAIETYQQALHWQPSYASAYSNLGDLYAFQKQDPQTAISYYQQALQYDPDFITALNNLGNTYLALGNIQQAYQRFERVLQLDPNFVPALGNLALIALSQGQTQRAQTYLYRVLKINPSDQRARALLNQIQNSR